MILIVHLQCFTATPSLVRALRPTHRGRRTCLPLHMCPALSQLQQLNIPSPNSHILTSITGGVESLQAKILCVCLFVRHRFNISNLGPSNHLIIMSDPTYYVSLDISDDNDNGKDKDKMLKRPISQDIKYDTVTTRITRFISITRFIRIINHQNHHIHQNQQIRQNHQNQ